MKADRVWLNPDPELTGSLSWSVGDDEFDDESKWLSAGVEIRDCTRTVTIDFSFYDEESARLALDKIALMRKQLHAFNLALAAGITYKRQVWEDTDER